MFVRFWSQVSSKAMLKEVKARLVDHLKAAGYNIALDDARLWLYSHDSGNPDKQIQNVAAKVCDGFLHPSKPKEVK